MAKMQKAGGIKVVLKQIEEYLKMCGKNAQIATRVYRGADIHHGHIMNRRAPNQTMTLVIEVNGGAENVNFAPPGLYA